MRCHSSVRYLKVTLIIGFLVALLVAILYEGAPFFGLEASLAEFTAQPFVPRLQRAVQYPLFVSLAFGIAWTTIDIPRNTLKAVVAVGILLQIISLVWVLRLLGIFFSPFPSLLAI